MQKKQYLVDTSVIIDNPIQNLVALYQNGENEIYITEVVLAELDKHKVSTNQEVGVAARTFFKAVREEFIKLEFNEYLSTKKLHEGDKLYKTKLLFENNEEVEIFIINRLSTDYRLTENNDSKILEIAIDFNLKLISNDTSFRVIAMSAGVKAESLRIDSVLSPEKIDFSFTEKSTLENLENTKKELAKKYKKWSQITIEETQEDSLNGEFKTGNKSFFIVNGTGLIPVRGESEQFKELIVKPLNMEQRFYAELLQQPFKILTVTGSTGSGKTLLAIQEAIRKVKDPNSPVDGIVYMRYTVNTTDKHAELGFRSGDENQKLSYFNYPLYAAINFIIEKDMERRNMGEKAIAEAKKTGINKNEKTEKFMEEFNITVADIAHARGITISNKVVIFDEVQNAPNSILQLVGTRIGECAQMILMGDFRQVDHPYLSKTRNGLVSLLKLADKGNPMLAAIQLKSTVRSEIAEWFQENIK